MTKCSQLFAEKTFPNLIQPKFLVGAFRVVCRGLMRDVKAPILARIVAHSSHIRPIAPIGLHVVIHKKRLEVLGPNAPVHAKFMHEMARHILS